MMMNPIFHCDNRTRLSSYQQGDRFMREQWQKNKDFQNLTGRQNSTNLALQPKKEPPKLVPFKNPY